MIFLLYFLTVCFVDANRSISRWGVLTAQKQGPNVCAVEVNNEINYSYYTEAKYWSPRNICGRQTMVRYECCSGYYKVAGYAGCVGVKPLINVIETSRRVGSSKFAKLIEGSRFGEELRHGSAITLFAPTDDALNEYLRIKGMREELLYNAEFQENLIANHIVGKRILSHQWDNDLMIPSWLQSHFLRLNRFFNGIETVNCHRIIRKDQAAINGIVHVIDGVLDPGVAYNSDVIDLASRDGRFSIFIRAFESSDLGDRMRFNEIPYTILAPTDEAFRNIPNRELDDILSNPRLLNALVANHIVTQPICIPNILGEYPSRTIQHQTLIFNCDSNGPTVEHVSLGQETYHGRNGLLYILNHVLLPDQTKSILQIIEEEGLRSFLEVVRVAGLEETLLHLQDFTIFVPSEEAMHSISQRQIEELFGNQEGARKFVLNHIVMGKYFTDEILSVQMARTIEEELPLRFQVYRGGYGVENALILKADRANDKGVLHVISHILLPAQQSLEHILQADGNFSIWLSAMDKIKHIEPQLYHDFKGANSSCTYFVPSDAAFRKLGSDKLRKLMEDTNYLSKTLKNHVADNMLLTESLKDNLQYSIPTRHNMVNIMKKNDQLHVNDADFIKYDILNQDGVAHEINAVLLPNQCVRTYRKRRDGSIVKICS